jgi:aspartate kinase
MAKNSPTNLTEPIEQERRVEEVDHVPHVRHVTVPISSPSSGAQADVVQVLELLDRAGIRINLLKVHREIMDFVVEGDCTKKKVEDALQREVEVMDNCSIVMLKSDSMRYLHGVMAAAVQALYGQGITVHETGDSYDSVSLVIDGKNLPRALKTLAKQFKVKAK